MLQLSLSQHMMDFNIGLPPNRHSFKITRLQVSQHGTPISFQETIMVHLVGVLGLFQESEVAGMMLQPILSHTHSVSWEYLKELLS
jgi:hypothetical protein